MDRGLDDAFGAANSLFTGFRICALRHLRRLSATFYATYVLGPPPRPQGPGAPRRKLSEDCAASSSYGDGNLVQPYPQDLMSWAAVGLVPVPIVQALASRQRVVR